MSGRVTSPRHIRRDVELAVVVDVLDRAAAGDPVQLLVGGEAGVGKTRLATETMHLAAARGFRVLRGHCVSVGEVGLPYGAIVEALRGLVQELGGGEARGIAGRGAADLSRLVPAFGTGPEEAQPPAEWAQTRLFEALVTLLTRLAGRAPVLLVVEDLHWADSATREALSFLGRGLGSSPVVVLATYRTDELHRRHPLLPWLAELDRRPTVQRLVLDRLDRAGIAELLAAILGEVAPAPLVDEVFERSDGNPFFAEELLTGSQGGRIGRRLPPTLHEILLARVARVPEPAGSVLSAAAAAGRTVDHALLARIAGLPEDRLLEGLRAAVTTSLLVVESDGHEDRYAFRHALVREAVYGELLPGERRRLHRTIAEVRESDVDKDAPPDAGLLAELANHWTLAREDDQAFAASLRAGDASLRAFAFEGALAAYETVLDLWDRVADARSVAGLDRVEVQRRAGIAAYSAGEYRRAVTHRRAAVRGVDAARDPRRAGMALEQLGRALYVSGDTPGSLEAYRAAVDTIPAAPPTAERARALSGLGQILMLLARYRESRVLCEEAVAMARACGDRAQEGHARNTLGFDLAMLGQCGEAIEQLREALRIARGEVIVEDVARAYVNLGEVLDACGRTAEALDVTDEGLQFASEVWVGFSYGYYLRLGGVMLAYALGRWDVAIRHLAAAREHEPVGIGAVAYRLPRSLPLLVGLGDWPAADAAITEALDIADEDRGAQVAGPVNAAIAELALWRGDPGAALAAVERGLGALAATDDELETTRLCRIGAWAAADLWGRAGARRDGHGREEAVAWMGRLDARTRTVTGPGSSALPALEVEVAALEAEASRLVDPPEPARWASVAAAWTALDRPYQAAYARWREAEAALATGDAAIATVALREAHAIVVRLRALPLADAVAALARRARIDLGPGLAVTVADGARPGDGSLGLTPRERDVLALVADGRTNRQIAAALFISESTAGVHVSNILGKLGVGSRTEAAAIAIRLRLVESGPNGHVEE